MEMRTTPILVLTLLAGLTATPALALLPNGCPEYEKPEITVKPLMTSPRYVDTLSLPQIKDIATRDHDNVIGSPHEVPVGLTSASLKLDTNFQVTVKSSPVTPMVCAQISAFELSFGFTDTTVYLARDLPKGSCSYAVVLDHETRHVGIDQSLVTLFSAQFPEYISRALASIGVVRASSAKVAEEKLRDEVRYYLGDIGKNLSQVRQKQQLQIDTQDEYGRLSKSCNGDLSRIIAEANKEEGR